MSSSRIALVTGASRGIGKAIAIELAQAGHTVIGTATTEAGSEGITSYLREGGWRGCGMTLDVTHAAQIERVHAAMRERFGEVEILVNNAGITKDGLLMRMTDAEWDAIVTTNMTSTFRLSRAVVKNMIKMHWGRIINISSIVGHIGAPGQSNYAASKAGIVGFTKSLACEVGARNITVNCVSPGFIETDMTAQLNETQKQAILKDIALHRFGVPDDIAAAVGFLASERAGFITGAVLHVNGGMYRP